MLRRKAYREIIRMEPPAHAERQIHMLQEMRDIIQQLIPRLFTKKIIDDLEALNIQSQDRKLHLWMHSDKLLGFLIKSYFIVYTSQGIIRCPIDKVLTHLAQGSDIQ